MKKITIPALLIWLSASLPAQTINYLEYWLDRDPGFGAATQISGFTPAADIPGYSFVIPVPSTVQPGMHTLGVRSRGSDGRWSHTNMFPVLIFPAPTAALIDSIAYWIDSDKGMGKVQAVSGFAQADSVHFAFNIPANLSVGIHTIGIRSHSNDGKWSHTNFFPVYVSDGDRGVITAIETFWETDPGFGKGTVRQLNAPFSHTFEGHFFAPLPANFVPGNQTLYVRTRGTRGNWSLTNYKIKVDTFVDAAELTERLDIRVFPNPFAEHITVIPPDDTAVRVFIYDPGGRLVFDQMVQGETVISLATLPAGAYQAFFWKDAARMYRVPLIKS